MHSNSSSNQSSADTDKSKIKTSGSDTDLDNVLVKTSDSDMDEVKPRKCLRTPRKVLQVDLFQNCDFKIKIFLAVKLKTIRVSETIN